MIAILLQIMGAVMPQIPTIIGAIVSLRKQYPELTPEQLQALVAAITSQADTAFDEVLAQIAADQAAHPGVPK